MLGPMVLCGVFGSSSELKALGVRDSKQLSPTSRELLSSLIRQKFEWKVVVVWPPEIDEAVERGKLNDLEAFHFASIIRDMSHDAAVIDCPDVDESRFAARIAGMSGCRDVTAEHRADVTYPPVSAASIVAKVMRDDFIAEIQSECREPIGSGYPSDEVTVQYVTGHYMRHSSLPPHVRKSWEPVKRLISNSKVKSLDDFRLTNDRGAD